MEGVKNLIIDLGGVLINLTRSRCLEAFENLGVENIRELLVSNYHHKDLFEGFELGTISIQEFHDKVRALSSKDMTDEEIDSAWIGMLGNIPEEKLRLLLELRKKYHTVLLSNTNVIHWKWSEQTFFSYQGHCASDFFRKIYLSYELHLQKPEAAIFEHVLKDSGMLAEETLLIDDSSVNCKTAGSLGLRTYTPQPGEDWSHLFR